MLGIHCVPHVLQDIMLILKEAQNVNYVQEGPFLHRIQINAIIVLKVLLQIPLEQYAILVKLVNMLMR